VATRLDAGFYAGTGSYWPPSTLITCRTRPGAGHPFIKPDGTGCATGAKPYRIPDDTPAQYIESPDVTWGTFLPRGWYFRGDNSADGVWTTVCWYARQPASGLPG
jgi:hypothetical protein